jgi:hypothetical protein
MHSQPYCNSRIILAIQHLYFTASGGSPSLATQFDDLFPGTTGDDGVMVPEVPIPMVALVATAVNACFPMHVNMSTEITSYLRPYMTGVPACSKPWSFQQMLILVFIKPMLAHFNSFRISGTKHSVP